MLQWLTFSARPLILEEVAEVVAIDVNDSPRFDPERRLAEPRDILTICSSLITVAIDGENSSNSVRLAHFSVKEYLVSERIRLSKAQGFSIQEVDSNGVIAEDCLAYLLQFDKVDSFKPRPVVKDTEYLTSPPSLTSDDLRKFPLALYAAECWTVHARVAEESDTNMASMLSLELLLAKGAELKNWIRLCDSEPFSILKLDPAFSDSMYRRDYAPILGSPLHYTSLVGLLKAVRLLLDRGIYQC